MRRDSLKTTSIARGSFFRRVASARASGEVFTLASRTRAPSAFETILGDDENVSMCEVDGGSTGGAGQAFDEIIAGANLRNAWN